jgi:hypothetical protein
VWVKSDRSTGAGRVLKSIDTATTLNVLRKISTSTVFHNQMDVCWGMLGQAKSQRHATKALRHATYHNVGQKGNMLVRQLLQDVDLGFKVIEEFGSQD